MTSLGVGAVFDLQGILDRLVQLLDLHPAEVRRAAVNLVVIWLLAWVSSQLIRLLARRIVLIAAAHHTEVPSFREKRATTIAQLVRSAGRGVVLIVAILLSLNQFINITVLLGGATVVGLAVSFGAQSLVKDYFAGFFILLENQFVVGDSIDAAGKTGVVEKLTLRTVTLRDIEGTVHIIPNGQITTLSNKTRGWSRAIVDIGISYDNDIDQVIAVLEDEARHLGTDAEWSSRFEAAPQVLGVESFTDNGVTIRVLLQTKPGMQNDVAREFRRRVMIRLEAEGIKGARSQQTIHLHQAAESVARVDAAPAPPSTHQANPAPPAPDPNASPIPGMS